MTPVDVIDHTPAPATELTPLMKQYWGLKAKVPDALLFFRMGDFYELFCEDAVEASRILEITLTSRDKGKANPMPMAGVPHHSAQGYIQKLLDHGKKVAIGEQMEDPALLAKQKGPKSIVRRDIVRVFTPAVQFDSEGSDSAYLATALSFTVTPAGKAAAKNAAGKSDVKRWILACLEPSTGETKVSPLLSEEALAQEILALPIRHFLRIAHDLPEEIVSHLKAPGQKILFEELPSNYLSEIQALDCLKRQYGLDSLDAFLESDQAAHALGVVLSYAVRTQQQERLAHLKLPAPLHAPRTLKLGPRTVQHLDLLPAPDGTPNLYQLINKTKSALGARQLRRWITEPLKAPAEITTRQTSVQELSRSGALCDRFTSQLTGLYDLERIMGRVNAKLANPRDTLALGRSLALVPSLLASLEGSKSPLLGTLKETLRESYAQLETLSDRITRTQKEDAPLSIRDAGIFAVGTTPELDRLISLTEDGQRWLVELETREREATGISSLKVRYNRVFGYYLEVTQSHLKNVPAHYQRKQTTVGAERFFTEELKKFEEEILSASSKQKSLEQELFEQLVTAIQQLTPAIMAAAQALAEIDALVSLARLAQEPGWSFPVIDDSLDFEITAGRHPLVDSTGRGNFVPNDLSLSDRTRLTLLITGPNMGGKSTVMRQAALIVILGQMGSAVPAEQAHWGAVSSLYTRIGAHDAISRGQSTFMVEMSELAHILHNADSRSLVILDEIGRGTSTYDGMSVAWSTLEWICTQIRCRTLFATHYHELTELAKAPSRLPLLANAHMAVEGTRSLKSGNLRFLYQLKDGPANESFGIHVARLAGLPAPVIERAWSVLAELETAAEPGSASTDQLSLFDAPKNEMKALAPFNGTLAVETPPQILGLPFLPVVDELREMDLNGLTPLAALNLLAKLQEDVLRIQN
ncbi:MAG: DNA mismatch repair protein MutS [Methylotenera sp.]|nr:DNA mismatch repair protein MutS [Oligoflexia bacterium]